MDFILQTKRFTKDELSRINFCRLYLDVHTISDIATACGKFLNRRLLQGNLNHYTSISNNLGTIQQKPSCKRSWNLWRRACTILCSNLKTKRLTTPLGPWIIPYTKLRRQWWLYSRQTNPLLLAIQ